VPEAQKHVLIVEDDAAIRDLIEDLLRDRGYAVSVAESGIDALEQIRENPPDLVVLDLMLPGMNGWTFLEHKAREQNRSLAGIPVLVVSASGPKGLGDAQELGAPVYLAKPFDIDHLLHEVERLCEGPVRQCAWCGQVMDSQGKFRLRSGRKLRWASHGICPICKERERRAFLN
jgi:CheY-like chemotaxis protein